MTNASVEAFYPFWCKHLSKWAGLWEAENEKPFVLNIHAQQPTLTLISTTDLPTIIPVPCSSLPTSYQFPYLSYRWTRSSLCDGFLWNICPVISWPIHICYLAGQLHRMWLLDSCSRHSFRGHINFGYLLLLCDFHVFGTVLSLKSFLVEIG